MASSGSIWVSLGLKTDKFSKGIKGAQKDLGGFGRATKDIAKLAVGAFAITSIVSFGKEAFAMAAQLEGVKQAFDRLNSPGLLENLKKATKGTVSDLELMKNAVKAKNLGIPVEKLGTMFEFARRRAKETGESVDFLVESITNGIGRKSPLILDNLGISASAIKDEFKKTGDFALAAANIIESEMGGMGEDIESAAETAAKLSAQLDNVTASAGQLGTEGLKAITPFLDGLLTGVKNIDLIWKDTFSGLADFTQGELERTLAGGWETEAGVNISKVVAAFDKIPFDKMKGNAAEMQKTWINILGEDSADAMKLFNGYMQQRVNLERQSILGTKEVIKVTKELTTKETKQAEEIRLLIAEYGNLDRVQSKGIGTQLQSMNTTNALTARMKLLKDELNNVEVGSAAFATLEAEIEALRVKMEGKALALPIIPELKPIPEEQMEALTTQEEVMQGAAAGMAGGVTNAFDSMSAGMANSMDEADSASGRFLKSLGGTVLKLIATNMASAMSNAITGATASGAATGPGAVVSTPAFIASAISGIIGAFAAIPKFADGGLVMNDMIGMIGEGRGTTKSNPEVIAPLDRLKKFMPNGDGGVGGEVVFRIKGDQLEGILKRNMKVNKFAN